MKVAHLDTGRDWRGGQAQVLHLMRGLGDRGVACLLLAPRGPLHQKAHAMGIEAHAWPSRGDLDLAACLRACRILRDARADVAHLHSGHAHALGAVAARWAGVPRTVVSRRVDFRVARHPLSAIKYRLPVDRYLCISEGVRAALLASGVPAERMRVVPSGIVLAPAAAEGVPDLRAMFAIPAEAPLVGTVAALAPHKHHAGLLDAIPGVLARQPGTHFVWLGDGPLRAMLERDVEARGLARNVHIAGFMPNARALMRQFTLKVLSSNLEGLCTSLLDALAEGVPVVATAVGGVPEVVVDGVTGRLVPSGDPAALANAIVEAIEHPGLRRAWVEGGTRHVERFSVDAMVEGTLAAYHELLGAAEEGP